MTTTLDPRTLDARLERLLDEASMTPWSAQAYEDLKQRLSRIVGDGADRPELRGSALYEAALQALVGAFLEALP